MQPRWTFIPFDRIASELQFGQEEIVKTRISAENGIGNIFFFLALDDPEGGFTDTHRRKNIRPVILFLIFKFSDCLVRCTPNIRVINDANNSVDEFRSGHAGAL